MGRPVLVLAAVLLAGAPVAAFAGSLYEIALDGQASLDAAADAGAVVRHVGTRGALVEGDEGLLVRLRGAGVLCRPLPRAGGPGDLYVCYLGRGADPSSFGEEVWREPGGAVLVRVAPDLVPALQAACFLVRRLPERVNAAGWFDDSEPEHVRRAVERDVRAVRGLVDDVMESVSSDSLLAHVRRLSRYPDGGLRSRYARRAECLTEAAPYLVERLTAALPASPPDTQRFDILGYTCEHGPTGPAIHYPAWNLACVLEGTGELPGCYVVSAHYDATAQRSFRDGYYWWCDNPAPGADDNATGAAVVLEAARVLAGVPLPFDVRFVLFSGEELGLAGSDAYADSVAAAGDVIYGVVNVDMTAYKLSSSNPDTCHIVTNPGSRWLADWMLGTVEEHPASFGTGAVLRVDEALGYSDHASFWGNGYDAVLAIEHVRAGSRNPVYHTLADTVGNVAPSQLALVARLVAGSVARFADPDALFNLAVFEEDVAFDEDDVQAGAAAPFSVDVHAFGPVEDADVTVRVWDGEPEDGDLLHEEAVSRAVGGGDVIRVEFEWRPGSGDVGLHELNVVVTAPGSDEVTLSDNRVSVPVYVLAPSLSLAAHFVYPNPARSLDEAAFRYELTREARAVVLTVLDLTGQQIARYTKTRDASAGDEANEGVLAGWNTVPWESLEFAGSPASGVYVYRIEVFAPDGGGSVDVETGRFALLR